MQAKQLLTIGLLALSALGAQARIGWTFKQCEDYYGPETGYGECVPESNYTDFRTGSFRIRAFAFKDETQIGTMLYWKFKEPSFKNWPYVEGWPFTQIEQGPSLPMTEAEVERIIALNGPDLEWKKCGRHGEAHVQYYISKKPEEAPELGDAYSRELLWTGYKDGKPVQIATYSDERGYWGPQLKIETVLSADEMWAFVGKVSLAQIQDREVQRQPDRAKEQKDAQDWQKLAQTKEAELALLSTQGL